MNAFILDTPTSYGSVGMLRTLVNAGITFKAVHLNVKPMPTDSENSKEWPLIFDCLSDDRDNREFQVRIHMVTCGYNGTGPNDLIECLKITGFGGYVSENTIYNSKEVIATYVK